MDSFDGRLAVVTGGASGMGRELAVQLAAEGCSVAVCDLNEDAASEATAEALEGAPQGTTVTAHVCDVADETSVRCFCDEVIAQHSTDHIDLLFNNAGIFGAGSFVADDRATWERVFSVCWDGVYNCTRMFMSLLLASGDGYLVNTSSANGFWATHGPGVPSTAYAAAKFAVKGFSEALIEDFRLNAPQLKVAVVMPGSIGTSVIVNSARVLGGSDLSEVRKFLEDMAVPLQGVGDDDLRRLVSVLDDVLSETVPTTASTAAHQILEGIRAGRWRIIIGDDARQLDERVRANPERAYDPDFPGLGGDEWLLPLLFIRGLFDPQADPELTATYELRFGDDPMTVRVANGELTALRGAGESSTAILEVDPETLYSLVVNRKPLDKAIREGAVTVSGDMTAVERLLGAITLHPTPAEVQ